jgi:rubredoxin
MKPRLMQGSRLLCPNCKMRRNILSYKHFQRVEEYADELNVVLKCSGCGHIFSPGMSDFEMGEMLRNMAQVETANV